MQGEHVDDLDIEFVVAAPVVIPNLRQFIFVTKNAKFTDFETYPRKIPGF